MPRIHYVMKTRTDLRYYPTADGQRTVSHLEVELDLPAWLWPMRQRIEQKLCQLKCEKDVEDIDMIKRREQIFGRGNLKAYLADHQFMLHKDDFVAHFGSPAAERAANALAARAVVGQRVAATGAAKAG
jgi:hypothetical protein